MTLRPAAPAKLEDALTRAQLAVNDAIRAYHDAPEDALTESMSINLRLVGEVTRLREALRPLVAPHSNWMDEFEDDDRMCVHHPYTFGEYRQAVAVLKEVAPDA